MLLEVETDKAVVEIEAAGDGVLGGVTAKEGDVVPVGQTIAWLLKPGEQPPPRRRRRADRAKMDSAPAAAAAAAPAAAAGSAAGRAHLSEGPPLAQEHGVDIARLQGSGRAARSSRMTSSKASGGARPCPPPHRRAATPRAGRGRSTPPASPDPRPSGQLHRPHHGRADDAELDDRSAFLRHPRRRCDGAERHARATDSDDREVARREGHAHRPDRRRGRPRAAAASAHERQLGQRQDRQRGRQRRARDGGRERGRHRRHPRRRHIGLGDIAKRREELSERARANRLQPADITGATFTISNLGMFDVDAFTAIIVPPQAGILAVGAIADRVVPSTARPVCGRC